MRDAVRRVRARLDPRDVTGPSLAGDDVAEHLRIAAEHAHMGTDLPPGTRLRGAKHAVLRAGRTVTFHQTTFNRQVLAALHALEEATAASVPGGVTAAVAAFEVQLQELAGRADATLAEARALRAEAEGLVEAARAEVRDLRNDLADARHRQVRAESELRQLRSSQDLVLRETRAADGGLLDDHARAEVRRQFDARYDDLYRDLEDTFRGSRDHVRSMLEDYVPDVADVAKVGGRVLDIGCGRGEWLELLRDHGIDAYGVDLNDTFVADNEARGLEVRVGDAVGHMRTIEPSSLAVVSAFHVAEHLSMDDLVEMVDAALRALRPGGLLLLETPNPLNLRVAATQFYLDPTHLKPLHPAFMEFLCTARGFVDVEIRHLHPMGEPPLSAEALGTVDPRGAQQLVDTLNWTFYGPQDFAVLARKVG